MLVSNSVIIHLHLTKFCAEEYLKQLQAPLAAGVIGDPAN